MSLRVAWLWLLCFRLLYCFHNGGIMRPLFSELKLLTQGWVMAMIAAYDNIDKMRTMLKSDVGKPVELFFLQTKTDSCFIAIYPEIVWVGICGTRNKWAWLSNLKIWRRNGYHAGISADAEKLITSYWRDVLRHTNRPIKLAGQSRGDPLSMYINRLLRKAGCRDVESIGWSGPYIAGKKGIEELKWLGVRHTHFYSDPSGGLPSDPTDDVGCVNGMHYGCKLNLGGSGGLFDHGYKAITKSMVLLYIKWSKKEPKWKTDVSYLASVGMEIAKK